MERVKNTKLSRCDAGNSMVRWFWGERGMLSIRKANTSRKLAILGMKRVSVAEIENVWSVENRLISEPFKEIKKECNFLNQIFSSSLFKYILTKQDGRSRTTSGAHSETNWLRLINLSLFGSDCVQKFWIRTWTSDEPFGFGHWVWLKVSKKWNPQNDFFSSSWRNFENSRFSRL